MICEMFLGGQSVIELLVKKVPISLNLFLLKPLK